MFKLDERQKLGIMVSGFVGLVGLILIVYFHFMIGRDTINDYERRTVNKKTELAEMKSQLEQINKTLSQKAEIEKQAAMISQITRRLPSSPDAPGFLNALVAILGTTGVFQEEVKPIGLNNDSPLYTEIPYSIKANGRYHTFGQFLTLVEQSPERFMRVKSLKVGNSSARPSIHPVEMEIATFMFKSNPGGGTK